jgi:hypothetical protein
MEELNLIEEKYPQRITREDVNGSSIKYVPNTNELYAASSWGYVYSFSAKKDGTRIGSKGPNGYLICNLLFSNGKRKMVYIHRVILETFVGLNSEKPCANHINQIRTDNRIENLEWCTSAENCNFGNHNKKLISSLNDYYKNRESFGRNPIRVLIYDINSGQTIYVAGSINEAGKFIHSATGNSIGAARVQISKLLSGHQGFNTVAGFGIRKATAEEYKEWNSTHINELLREEPIDLSLVPVGKLNKLENLVMTNRKLDPKTGKVSYTYTTFSSGDKITNHLQ